MSLSERSAPHASEGRQGPSVTSTTNTSSLRSTASAKRAFVYVDSTGSYRSDDLNLMLAAIMQDAEADRQYGRPLDYGDPTGDRATWNALVTATVRGRGRP